MTFVTDILTIYYSLYVVFVILFYYEATDSSNHFYFNLGHV
jgi:hypothetical protein